MVVALESLPSLNAEQLRELAPPSMTDRLQELGVENISIPLEWEETIAACLEKEPSRRPMSMRAVERRLFRDEQPTKAPPARTRVAVARPGHLALAGYMLLLAGVLALLGWFFFSTPQANRIKALFSSGSTQATSRAQSTFVTASIPSPQPLPSPQGAAAGLLASSLHVVADDFVVDVYLNGREVPDSSRRMVQNAFGATAERIDLPVHPGDWLVFNVVNNRLRWNGAYYFAVAGLKADKTIGFTSELESGRWCCCDDPAEVPRFISDPNYLAANRAHAVAIPWAQGDKMMKNAAGRNWQGRAIWGTNRNTWIKFVAR